MIDIAKYLRNDIQVRFGHDDIKEIYWMRASFKSKEGGLKEVTWLILGHLVEHAKFDLISAEFTETLEKLLREKQNES